MACIMYLVIHVCPSSRAPKLFCTLTHILLRVCVTKRRNPWEEEASFQSQVKQPNTLFTQLYDDIVTKLALQVQYNYIHRHWLLSLIDNKNEFEFLGSSYFFYLIHGYVKNLNHQFWDVLHSYFHWSFWPLGSGIL